MNKDYPVNYPELIVPKADGVTDSEKKLITLGYQSFFSLWSYPNPFRKHKLDKELCDLLVVFGDEIIIFSDKDIAFPDEGDIRVNWRRWYKKAITKSCDQLCGAMSWIKKYPDRIALDPKGEIDFPLTIQVTEKTRFHLVSVAHGIKDACIKHFEGGDGGLIVDNRPLRGSNSSDVCEPFRIGIVNSDPGKFVHIFDDASYALILRELDTIRDFIDYLNDRQTFLLSEKHIIATSEQEMLAIYQDAAIHGERNGLTNLLAKYSGDIFLDEGLWDEFVDSKSFRMWKKQIEISYFWDDLLKKTIGYIERGQSLHLSHPSLDEQSRLFYQMAKESRYRRMVLSEGILSFFFQTPDKKRATRIIINQQTPDMAYVLLLLPRLASVTDESYRSVRAQMLTDYCYIAKADHPQLRHIFGIAHETNDLLSSSEEFLYFDASYWTEEDQKSAIETKEEYVNNNLLGEQTAVRIQQRGPEFNVKGRDRNKPCPCGSGIKYKFCCGKKA